MGMTYPLRPGEPDCRDYLRTGCCKYGDSCKYNHPPNVEVGGGVKPFDPSEPLFPIRPNEPPCQYFLKHGTCKFGQSCKFNHPAGASQGPEEGFSNTISEPPTGLVYLTTNTPAIYSVESTSNIHSSGAISTRELPPLVATTSNIQILPQRPNEPHCIYFLRNGRCKYGVTCKFHHPIDTGNDRPRIQAQSHSFRRDRSNSCSGYGQAYRLQPITEQVRLAPHKPTHILLPDGQIAVIIDPQSLQQVGDINGNPKFFVAQTDGSVGTVHSFDQSQLGGHTVLSNSTHSSSLLTLESNNDLWSNRIPSVRSQGGLNGSGGSLSAFGSEESMLSLHQGHSFPSNQGQLYPLHRQPWTIELNEGDMYPSHVNRESISIESYDGQQYEQYRLRAASLGSTIDQSSTFHFPSSRPQSMSNQQVQPQGNFIHEDRIGFTSSPLRSSVASETGLNSSKTQSFDKHTLNGSNSLGHESCNDDDGLSLMTSALLTMIDRHDNNSAQIELSKPQLSSPVHPTKGYHSLSEPNIVDATRSPTLSRPLPGMKNYFPLSMSNQDQSHSVLSSVVTSPSSGQRMPRV